MKILDSHQDILLCAGVVTPLRFGASRIHTSPSGTVPDLQRPPDPRPAPYLVQIQLPPLPSPKKHLHLCYTSHQLYCRLLAGRIGDGHPGQPARALVLNAILFSRTREPRLRILSLRISATRDRHRRGAKQREDIVTEAARRLGSWCLAGHPTRKAHPQANHTLLPDHQWYNLLISLRSPVIGDVVTPVRGRAGCP